MALRDELPREVEILEGSYKGVTALLTWCNDLYVRVTLIDDPTITLELSRKEIRVLTK